MSSRVGGLIACLPAGTLFVGGLVSKNYFQKIYLEIRLGNLNLVSAIRKVFGKVAYMQDKVMLLFAVFAGVPICLIPWIRSVQELVVTNDEWAAIYFMSFWTVRIVLLLLAWPSVVDRIKNGKNVNLHSAKDECSILMNAIMDYVKVFKSIINVLLNPKSLKIKFGSVGTKYKGFISAVIDANEEAKKLEGRQRKELDGLMENKKLRASFSVADVNKKMHFSV